MRIIAGQWRSRRLERPIGAVTRPMPDRLKETIFNVLGSYYGCPGGLPALRVADVFCGSGSMGLEALSRGAAFCAFIERDARALTALRRNLDTVAADPATVAVVRGDAWRRATCGPDGRPFDLVFLDPPFRNSQDTSEVGPVRTYLGLLELVATDHREGSGSTDVATSERVVVLHHAANARFAPRAGDRWTVMDQRVQGRNAATFFRV
jgi:16S rRNA (guanine966-N2)-methyltransferase